MSEFWHWFVANIPGDSVDDGEVIFELLFPLVLPEGDGDHRYGFFVFEQPKQGSNFELQSSRYQNSKALDEIYKINVGSRMGHGVEAAPAADNVGSVVICFVFNISSFFTFSQNATTRSKYVV